MTRLGRTARALGRKNASIAVQSSLLTLARAFGFLASLGIPLVLVRTLDQTEYGLYKLVFLIVGTAQPVLQLGMSAAVYYFVPRAEEGAGRGLLLQTACLLPVMGLLGGLSILLLADPLAAGLNAPALTTLMPAIALIVFMSTPGELMIHIPIVEQRPVLAASVLAGGEIVKGTALITAGLVFGAVEAVAWAGLAVPLLQVTLLVVYLTTQRGSVPFRWDWGRLREHLAYALPFWLTVLCQIGLEKAHQFYVTALTTPKVFAIYANGIFQIPLAGLLVQSVAEVLIVRSSAAYKHENRADMWNAWRAVTNRLAVPLMGLFVWAWVFAPALILTLFGEPYRESIPIFRILLLTIPLIGIVDHGILRAVGDTRFMLRAALLALAVSVAGLLVLTRIDMMLGAVTAYVIGIGTARLAGAFQVSRHLRKSFVATLPVRSMAQSLVLGAAAAAVAFVATGPMDSNLMQLLASVLLYGIVYWGAVLLTGVIPASEFRELLTRFRPEGTDS